MDQQLILNIAIPFALASYVPLLAAAVSTGLVQKLRDREVQTRSRLVDGGIKQLRVVQLALDEFFSEWDPEEDPFFIKARPRDLKRPVAEYLRYISLQDKMQQALRAVAKLTRIAFWFVVAFSILTTAAVVFGIFYTLHGDYWAVRALIAAGVVFFIGGSLYLLILWFARRVDKAHSVAIMLEGGES
ncbi:hypothetical protein [uncultured Microbacterium sp.]|uniref:hypothetical protein n=1 Tax=uncultured Microbacterium sp. TaxID=191216 RepID=UPI0028DB21F9|nr:hypothetical protein [uncultured Microbacterium sp.]